MKDYSRHYKGRQMITGFFDDGGTVEKVQAFYCTNGPEHDGRLNVIVNGESCPGPENRSPYYFVPSAGCSVSRRSIHETREEATEVIRKRLLAARQRIDEQLEVLA